MTLTLSHEAEQTSTADVTKFTIIIFFTPGSKDPGG